LLNKLDIDIYSEYYFDLLVVALVVVVVVAVVEVEDVVDVVVCVVIAARPVVVKSVFHVVVFMPYIKAIWFLSFIQLSKYVRE
jgi:hypothetical protein